MIPASGRSPREGNGNPLQYSCLENSMDRGAWRAAVHGVAKSRTRLNDKHTKSRQEHEWVTIPFCRGSSQPRDQTQVSCVAGGSLPLCYLEGSLQKVHLQKEKPQ